MKDSRFVDATVKGCLVIFVAALTLLVGYLAESSFGSPLTETVTVARHQYTPGYTTYAHKPSVSQPPKWTLHVSNAYGSSTVETSRELYEQTHDGDKITVHGRKGFLSGHWYLNRAEPFK